MTNEPQVTPLDFYLRLMEEIKVRIDYINRAMALEFKLPLQLVREFCYLQLRMIFELVALACLSINSRHLDTRRLEKQWNANELIARLSELNPQFFPKAVIVRETPQGFDCQDIDPQPMTRKDFLRFYGACGATLHRGSLRNAIKVVPSGPPISDDVRVTLRAIVDLLNTHRVPSPDLKTHYVCNMINGPGGRAAMITTEMQPMGPTGI